MLRSEEAVTSWPVEPTELLRRLYPELRRLAGRLAPRDPEDLVQESLVRVLMGHPGFGGISFPLGYSRTVLIRLASQQRNLASSVEAMPPDLLERLEVGERSPWEELIEGQVDLERRLRRLGSRQRACVYLKVAYGMRDSEIAQVLGIETSTVRSQVARGLKRLKDAWQPQIEEEER
jgi:RNA polymerase sigma factor (sigma-70 family)